LASQEGWVPDTSKKFPNEKEKKLHLRRGKKRLSSSFQSHRWIWKGRKRGGSRLRKKRGRENPDLRNREIKKKKKGGRKKRSRRLKKKAPRLLPKERTVVRKRKKKSDITAKGRALFPGWKENGGGGPGERKGGGRWRAPKEEKEAGW